MTRLLLPPVLFLAVLGLALALKPAALPYTLHADLAKGTFEVRGIAPANRRALQNAGWDAEKWNMLLAVFADTGELQADSPALGTCTLQDDVLRFEMRYSPVENVRYRLVFQPALLPDPDGPGPVSATFELPRKPSLPTSVTAVYPTAEVVPENLLKFYIHFSAPMSRGEAYDHIKLLDESGQQVVQPFLELSQELWDGTEQRFTLLLDPGRIKRGLKPREEDGPVLEEGKRYTLVVDRSWRDGVGLPLNHSFRKEFRSGPPIEETIKPSAWRIESPRAGQSQPLTVVFTRPLDHAMLQRVLQIVGPDGRLIAGSIRTTAHETCWQFSPDKPWTAGTYRLIVETILEDLAGNSIARPFEVDAIHPREDPGLQTIELTFTVRD